MEREAAGGEHHIVHHEIKHPPDMALGCFIGVMVLLIIVILFLGFSNKRINQLVINQNSQMEAMHRAAELMLAKNIKNRINSE